MEDGVANRLKGIDTGAVDDVASSRDGAVDGVIRLKVEDTLSSADNDDGATVIVLLHSKSVF